MMNKTLCFRPFAYHFNDQAQAFNSSCLISKVASRPFSVVSAYMTETSRGWIIRQIEFVRSEKQAFCSQNSNRFED